MKTSLSIYRIMLSIHEPIWYTKDPSVNAHPYRKMLFLLERITSVCVCALRCLWGAVPCGRRRWSGHGQKHQRCSHPTWAAERSMATCCAKGEINTLTTICVKTVYVDPKLSHYFLFYPIRCMSACCISRDQHLDLSCLMPQDSHMRFVLTQALLSFLKRFNAKQRFRKFRC